MVTKTYCQALLNKIKRDIYSFINSSFKSHMLNCISFQHELLATPSGQIEKDIVADWNTWQ